MTALSDAFRAHLEGDVTTLCHCWRVTRADGTVSGYTDHDRALTVDGTNCEPRAGFSASEARQSLGLAVDTADVEGALDSEAISEADIAAGRYDGAKVETLLVNWAAPEQFALLRKSFIGRIRRDGGRFVAELESLAAALDQPSGRRYARRCDAELGDARCGFDLGVAGYSATGSLIAIDSAGTLTVNGLAGFASGWFSNGVLTWTSGALAGLTERIVAHRALAGAAELAPWSARSRAASPGDAFAIVAGCDKRFATCKAKFDNGLNFRGFPHLPGNDAAYGYAFEGGEFDGGPLVP